MSASQKGLQPNFFRKSKLLESASSKQLTSHVMYSLPCMKVAGCWLNQPSAHRACIEEILRSFKVIIGFAKPSNNK
jgi:hypothetical protein